jgi:hypothetical protein
MSIFVYSSILHPLTHVSLPCTAVLCTIRGTLRQCNQKHFYVKLTYVTEGDQSLLPPDISFKLITVIKLQPKHLARKTKRHRISPCHSIGNGLYFTWKYTFRSVSLSDILNDCLCYNEAHFICKKAMLVRIVWDDMSLR